MNIIEKVLEFCEKFGIWQGLIGIIILGLFYWLFTNYTKAHERALEEKEKEIKRLVEDNKYLRETFKELISERLGIKTNKEQDSLELKTQPIKEKSKTNN